VGHEIPHHFAYPRTGLRFEKYTAVWPTGSKARRIGQGTSQKQRAGPRIHRVDKNCCRFMVDFRYARERPGAQVDPRALLLQVLTLLRAFSVLELSLVSF